MLIFLLRHGLTDWNVTHRCQGSADIPLNADGLAQAEMLAAACKSLGFERVYHSPLVRAAATAEKVAVACHAPLIPCDDLREMLLGAFQGLTRTEAAAAYPDIAPGFFSGELDITPPGGESMADVQRRALAALDFCERDAAGCSRIALVSHGALIKTLVCGIIGAPLNCFRHFDISNCSISVLESTGGMRRLVTLNDMSPFGDCYATLTATRLMI